MKYDASVWKRDGNKRERIAYFWLLVKDRQHHFIFVPMSGLTINISFLVLDDYSKQHIKCLFQLLAVCLLPKYSYIFLSFIQILY